MSTDVVATPHQPIARTGMTTEQVDLIRRTLAAGATDDELALFIGHCNRTGLDPFARQIYLVPRRSKVNNVWVEVHQTMVSIDGARLIAQRDEKYRGQLPTEWCADDGVWKDAWLSTDPPVAARVAVIHADYPDRPVWGIARYGAYVQTIADGSPNTFWRRMPEVMLAKCAEMLAMRKAFQQDLSGLVIEEESGVDPIVLEAGSQIATASTQPLPRIKATKDEEKQYVDAARAKGLLKSEMSKILDEHGEGVKPPWSDQIPAILDAIERHGMDDIAAVTAAAQQGEEKAEVVPDAETVVEPAAQTELPAS